MKYAHESWSAELPDHLLVEEAEECVTLYDPDGAGAFQVSSYLKEDGDVTVDDLLSFAEVDAPEETDIPFLNGIFKRITDGQYAIHTWWLAGANQLIYATYICAIESENVESPERHNIIRSLQSLHVPRH